MPTFVYSPSVEVHIQIQTNRDSTKDPRYEVLDVSEDVVRGSVHRVNRGVSTCTFTLLNQNRKYDRLFAPMDKVVIYLRRIKRMLVFSGYLDAVPLYSTYPGSVQIRGSCTLKRLQHYLWDPNSPAAAALLRTQGDWNDRNITDGGMAKRTQRLLTEVAGWPKEQIHIGAVPEDWFDRVSKVADRLIAEADAAEMAAIVGTGLMAGDNPALSGVSSIQTDIKGAGTLPDTRGKISAFGGPNGGAYGNMALTGEPGVNPRDPWYCAMRWPYVTDQAGGIPGVDVGKAQAWWRNRKILAVNPKTHKAVVVRAADWGPHITTGRVLDLSPRACDHLGGTDATVNIVFAPPDAKLGPISGSAVGSTLARAPDVTVTPTEAKNWGRHGVASDMREISVKVGGRTIKVSVNKRAVTRFSGFLNDLINIHGYKPKIIYGYNDRKISGSSQWSNHAWGAAIDIDPGKNPYAPAGTPHTIPNNIVSTARKWGLGWGGEWSGSKDYMHFEVIGAPASSAAAYKGADPKANLETGAAVASYWESPVTPVSITARFGQAGDKWDNNHTGLDLDGETGDRVEAVGPGTVQAAFPGEDGPDSAWAGKYVIVDHTKGVTTWYCHLSAVSVAKGDSVTASTKLGEMGQTGNAFGAHLHLELRLDGKPKDPEPYVIGKPPPRMPPRGVAGATAAMAGAGAGGNQLDLDDIGAAVFNVYQWMEMSDYSGRLLSGHRALMNDEPILNTAQNYLSASLRDYCSAPNGDFIAWFPDYFGHWDTAGKMVVSDLEIDAMSTNGLTIGWDDTHLKTHQFVSGAMNFHQPTAGDVLYARQTAGIASVEEPELMGALFNVDPKMFADMGKTYLARYGARVEWTPMNNITGHQQEFFFACHLFMRNWSQQFAAQIGLTFMPELFPGMLACFPMFGIQGYVEEVTHSWDMSDESGFKTDLRCSPWSTIGKKGPIGLPYGAPL